MLPNIYNFLPNDDVEYVQYGGVFLSIIHIIKTLLGEGVYTEHINEQHLPTLCESTKNMLLDAVELICYGQDEVAVSLIMNIRYNRQLLKQGVTEQELNELLIAKELIRLFMKHEYSTIHDIINLLGDESVRRTMLADYPLSELNKNKEE